MGKRVNNNKRKETQNHSSNNKSYKKQTNSGTNSASGSKPESADSTKPNDGNTSSKTEEADSSNGSNDPAWYTKFPELMDAANNVPFSNPFGMLYDQLKNSETLATTAKVIVKFSSTDPAQRFAEPGFQVVYVKPSLGGADTPDDAVNVAAHLLYGDVRAKNSGRKNYDQNDLMMYILAVSELIGYVMWAKRLYCAAFVQSQRSYYINKLLPALGGDTSLIHDLAQFRSWINLFIAKMSTLVVPANIELFKRRAFLYETIYTEDANASVMDQMYCFSPACFMKFGYDSTHVGCLEPIYGPKGKLVDTYVTLADIVSIGESLLENIVGNEDFAVMAGDILKYCEGNILTVSLQDAEGVIVPVYDPYVLAQIHNADVLDGIVMPNALLQSGSPTTISNITYEVRTSITDPTQTKRISYGGIYQDGLGLIRAREAVIMNGATPRVQNVLLRDSDRVILSPDGDTSPEYVIESTRLKCVLDGDFSDSSSSNFSFASVRCGTDIVVTVRAYTIERRFNTDTKSWSYEYWTTPAIDANYLWVPYTNHSTTGGIIAFNDFLRRLNAQIHGKWNPYLMLITGASSVADGVTTFEIMREIPISNGDTFSIQSQSVIKRLHDVSWLSLTCANSRAII